MRKNCLPVAVNVTKCGSLINLLNLAALINQAVHLKYQYQ